MTLSKFKNNVLNVIANTWNINSSYFIKGGFWLGFQYCAIAFFKLLRAIFLAHFVDKQFFGQYQFIMAMLSTITIFSLPGIDTAITQSVANRFSSSLVYGTKAKLKWSLLGSTALIGVGLFFKFVKPQDFWFIFIFAALLFPMYASFTSIYAYYYGKENFRKAALYATLVEGITTIAIIAAIIITKSLGVVIISMLAVTVAIFILLYANTRREITLENKDPDLIRYGLHLNAMLFIAYISPQIDSLLVSFFLGFEELATYSIIMAVLGYILSSVNILNTLVLPKFSRDRADHFSQIKRLLKIIIPVSIFSIALIIILAPWVIPILFSEKYAETTEYIKLGSSMLLFAMPSSILIAYLSGRKKTRLLYFFNVGGGIANILLLSVLIPFFGIGGAIVGKIILNALGFGFLLLCIFL